MKTVSGRRQALQRLACAGLTGFAGSSGLVALGACTASPLPLTFLGSMTGRVADLGVAGRDGALLAVEGTNASGGVRGRQVVLQPHDLAQDAALAQTLVRTLRAQGHELAIGPMTSSMAMAMVPEANAVGLTLISPTVTTAELDGLDDQFLRVASSARVYARHSAAFHRMRWGWQRYAVIYDRSNLAYTRNWMTLFEAELQASEGRIVFEQDFAYEASLSFDALVRPALEVKADALLIIAGAMDAARLAQAIRRHAPTMPLLATEWASTPQLLSLGGRAIEGMHLTQYLDLDSREPAYLSFQRRFRERFGREPGFAEVASFDATRIALRTLAERARSETVKQAVMRLRRFHGLQQEVVFGPHGDAEREVAMTVVRDGRFVTVR